MSACSQCGTVAAKDSDKFCNVCGSPLPRPAQNVPPQAPPGPQYAPTPLPSPAAGYGPPPSPFGAQGGPPPPRCQMGHEIAPGASYCAHGHPIALDQMQFSNDAYGAGQYPQQGGGYGAPQRQAPGGYGAPPAPYGAPPPQPVYTPPPPPQAYAPPPSPPQPAYPPPVSAPQQGYAPSPGSPFGAPPPPLQPLPPLQGGYGPPQHPGFPQAPQAPYGAQQAPAYPAEAAAPSKILRGFLVAYGLNPSGDFWPLTGGRLLVGRLGAAEGIDISMQDPTISSRHAAMVIDASSGAIVVEDTGSTNGTFVNDEHIGFNGRRDLRDGDRLRFGGFTTVVKVIGRV
jgi:pSer/pThr/pTyr-binding forkhead associated (FHA) protein